MPAAALPAARGQPDARGQPAALSDAQSSWPTSLFARRSSSSHCMTSPRSTSTGACHRGADRGKILGEMLSSRCARDGWLHSKRGRTNFVLKTLQLRRFCPTQACTTPPGAASPESAHARGGAPGCGRREAVARLEAATGLQSWRHWRRRCWWPSRPRRRVFDLSGLFRLRVRRCRSRRRSCRRIA